MISKGLFHGQGKYKQPNEGLEYEGVWVRNEMLGNGVKKIRWGEVEIQGYFNGQHVTGKGVKKWRVITTKMTKSATKQRETKVTEWYVYRGELENS